ncbi:MAG: PKD domain-containing protein, partial [Candidatus Electrothrix sp. AUS1_2]|nr:PKD domain-containing protein [Candidatus Electrothrix sp. AUS1_2]
KYTAEAISHEVGHTLGLYHDGDSTTGYYAGHGNWAPIMGVGYYKSVTQFSKGEYSDANNMEDDLAIISGSFIPYRPDDHGDTDATASPLSSAGGVISGSGIIERNSDTDVFSVVAGTGEISLTVNTDTLDCIVAAPDYPDCHQPNLDIQADLYDDAGNLIISSNPVIELSASIETFVNEGTYYLHITGVGTGDPVTGYSDYGSLGKFVINGTVPEPGADAYPVAAASASPVTGEIPLTVNFSSAGSVDPDGTITAYAWDFADGGLSNDPNTSNTYITPGVFTAVLTVTDNDGYTDTASVTITATAPDTTVNTPTDLAVTVNGGTVHLTWTDNAGNEEGVRIERAEKIRGTYTYSYIGQVGADATSFADSPGVGTFQYRVQAFNDTTETVSGYSNAVLARIK